MFRPNMWVFPVGGSPGPWIWIPRSGDQLRPSEREQPESDSPVLLASPCLVTVKFASAFAALGRPCSAIKTSHAQKPCTRTRRPKSPMRRFSRSTGSRGAFRGVERGAVGPWISGRPLLVVDIRVSFGRAWFEEPLEPLVNPATQR